VLVRARRPSLELSVAARLEHCGQADPRPSRDLSDLLRRLEDMPPVLRPELGDHPPAPVGIGLVPEREISIRQLLGRLGPGVAGRICFAHHGDLL
jgi:hypothetical protein